MRRAEGEADWGSRRHVETLVLLTATALALYFCARLAAPFLPALVWALALAVLFAPLQRWLESKLRYPSLAASISVAAIGLIVVVLAGFVAQRLVQQAVQGAELVEAQAQSGAWRRNLEAEPRLATLIEAIDRRFDVEGVVTTFTDWLSGKAAAVVKGSVFQIAGFFLTLYLLFYFLRDRQAALEALRGLSPLTRAEMDHLFVVVGDTIHATIYGTLAVALVQGVLGGLMFWWLGLPAAWLWGLVMALLAVVPILGAFVVWIPAALFLALEGSWGKALILTLWGTVVVGTIDNLLQPMLVGRRLRLHTLLAFVAVVGGLMLFGAAGLILGPMILSITQVLLEVWSTRTRPATLPAPKDSDAEASAPVAS